jgi:hypothetical protein
MFYLVDPEIQTTVSTGSVAPQQKDWIKRAVEHALGQYLPIELIELIFSFFRLMDL